MPLTAEAVTLGMLAKPGVRTSIEVSVSAPPWLSTLLPGQKLPCWDVDPELFFPFKYNLECKEQIEEAARVCARCPVRDLCLEWALPQTDLDGLWAGTTPMDRRRIRTGKKPRPPWALNREETAA